MDLETKKDLTSNWFKTLQNAICNNIDELENNKIKFKSTIWKRNKKKMKAEVNIKFLIMGKFLTE